MKNNIKTLNQYNFLSELFGNEFCQAYNNIFAIEINMNYIKILNQNNF